MKNFPNNPSQSANPTIAMNYIDFLDARTNFDLSAFDEFMGYDCAGNSMRLDEYLFFLIRNTKPSNLVHFDYFFDESFTGLLEPGDTQRLLLDLIMFSKRFPDVMEFMMIDERHQPIFFIK